MSPSKQEQKRKWKDSTHTVAGLRLEGPCEKDCGPPLGAERQRNGNLSPITTSNWILPPTWMSMEANSFPEPPDKISAANSLTSTLEDPEQRTQPYHIRLLTYRTEIMSKSCFKLLNLWQLVMTAAIENYYNGPSTLWEKGVQHREQQGSGSELGAHLAYSKNTKLASGVEAEWWRWRVVGDEVKDAV